MMSVDTPNVFIQVEVDRGKDEERIIMKITGKLVDILLMTDAAISLREIRCIYDIMLHARFTTDMLQVRNNVEELEFSMSISDFARCI